MTRSRSDSRPRAMVRDRGSAGARISKQPLCFTLARWNGADPILKERAFGLDNSINDYVVLGQRDAVNPAQRGTKVSALYELDLAAGAQTSVRLRLTAQAPYAPYAPFADFDEVFTARMRATDAFYDAFYGAIPLAIVDMEFAKEPLDLLLRNDYLHPNGPLPACEWNFSDENPPVHAWATMQLSLLEQERRAGQGDLEFLKQSFEKLLVNFTW